MGSCLPFSPPRERGEERRGIDEEKEEKEGDLFRPAFGHRQKQKCILIHGGRALFTADENVSCSPPPVSLSLRAGTSIGRYLNLHPSLPLSSSALPVLVFVSLFPSFFTRGQVPLRLLSSPLLLCRRKETRRCAATTRSLAVIFLLPWRN